MKFVDEEGGFTSLGAVVAMLLVVALVTSSARVYWVASRSDDIQFAADAGALASQNVVANYVTVVNVADATVLSMSLLGLSLYAVSTVAACIPAVGSAIASGTSKVAHSVMEARDKFATTATDALEALQKTLPFICALNAMAAIEANGDLGNGQKASLVGLAIPVPLEGTSYETSDSSDVNSVGELADETNEQTAQASTQAEEASESMRDALQEAYDADCGNNPGYCLYQRAQTLAGLGSGQNPYYASVDLWSFSVPLQRAKAYYVARYNAEPGRDGTGDYSNPEEAVRSIARAKFYLYAYEVLQTGSVYSDGGVIVADLPTLPQNTDDMKATYLYTEQAWPLTSADGVTTLHASMSCPVAQAQTASGQGALSDLDAGAYSRCETCVFDIRTLGRVPAASTSIDNGFEHYWRIIANASGRYTEAARQHSEQSREAKENAEGVFEKFKEALSALATTRFDPQPPGRYGSIAIAIDVDSHSVPTYAPSLDGGEAQLGIRVAVSAATLAKDEATSANNLISSLTAGLADAVESQGSGGASVGSAAAAVLSGVTGVWGDLLLAYCDGGTKVFDGIKNIVGKIPVVGGELSEWAVARLGEVVELAGLQAVDLSMRKPILCNTSDVAERGSDAVSQAMLKLRSLSASMGSAGLSGVVDSIVATARSRLENEVADGITFNIKLVNIDGFPEIPVTIRLPSAITEAGEGVIDGIAGKLGSWAEGLGFGGGVWR